MEVNANYFIIMTLRIEDASPFPYIIKSSYDFQFEKIRSKVDAHLAEADAFIKSKDLITLEKGGGVTTATITNRPESTTLPPHKWEEFEDFNKNFLRKCGGNVWDLFDYEPTRPRTINGSWINVHPKGGYTASHHHHGCPLAIVCYLHVPKGSGRLLIKNPMDMYTHALPIREDYFDSDKNRMWRPVEVETNDVLFFPGYLEHKTEINKTDEKRYIMSVNISVPVSI